MRVKVLFFGVLKDRVGVAERTVELAGAASVGDVVQMCQPTGDDAAVWRSIAVAVNREYAGREQLLSDGDEVAMLPPVSGGRGCECDSPGLHV